MSVSAPQVEELLERDVELTAIGDLVRRAGDGKGGAVLVEGAAGIGKTALLTTIAELARGGPVRVLRARGGELEKSFPFGIVGQLFAGRIASLSGEQRSSVLSGAAELAIPVVDPRLAVPSPAMDSREALYARLHGLYWLCMGLAALEPLVLVVDDAHWADEPSLQWLLFLARRMAEMPVAVVLAARPHGGDDWPEPLVLLRQEAGVSVIRPEPLTRRGSHSLLARLLGEDPEEPFSAACHDATGGNPFYLTELIASVRDDGLAPSATAASQIRSLAPDGIVRSIVVRLGRMSGEAGALARAIAVLGRGAKLRHAAALAGLDLDTASAAADALAHAGLLEPGRPLRFAHPVVRSAVYSELPAGQRARLHRQAAGLLADEDGDIDVIAAHLLASEPAGEQWTIELLQKAAEHAMAQGVPRTAAEYLRRVLAEPPAAEQRAAVLRRLGVIETFLGEPGAAEHVRQAIELTRESRQRGELALELSYGFAVGGRFGEAISVLEDAIEQLDDNDQELRWRLEAQAASWARVEAAHAEVARRHLDRVPHDLRGDSPGERAILAELAYAALIEGKHVEVVKDLATRALAGGQFIDEQHPGSLLAQNALGALVLCEQHDFAMDTYDRLIAQSARNGSPVVFALISGRRSQLHYLRGAIAEAIADIQAAIDAGRHLGPSLIAPALFGSLIQLCLEAGDLQGAERALASTGLSDAIPPILPLLTVMHGRGRLRLACGDTDAGINDLLATQAVLSRARITNPARIHCRATAAIALAARGRREEARQLVCEELADARKFGANSTVGISLRAAGVIEGGSAGIDQLRDAVTLLERSPARLEHARALADLGAALRRAGKRREAQQALRQALDLADRCGGRAVAEQARSELVITGARPRRARLSGVDALTASERRVAQMAAEGLTNRQIAQALFVSHPTVVTHLSRCYQKLNISSREQLSAALATATGDAP